MDEEIIKQVDSPHQKTGYLKQLFQIEPKQEPVFYQAAEKAAERLSDIPKDDVKGTAASQIELLSSFYDLSLSQAQRSFRWALIASMTGLIFFLMAIAFMIFRNGAVADIALISGGIIELIAALNFYLYNRTLAQLTLFQGRLETTQRFLLANSLTESLGDEFRDKTRAQLISQLANSQYEKLSGRRKARDRNHHDDHHEDHA